MQDLTKKAISSYTKEKAVGKVSLSLVLSRSLNIEYFRLFGSSINKLSNEDVLNIYDALSQPGVFSLWTAEVPYVWFDIIFFLD